MTPAFPPRTRAVGSAAASSSSAVSDTSSEMLWHGNAAAAAALRDDSATGWTSYGGALLFPRPSVPAAAASASTTPVATDKTLEPADSGAAPADAMIEDGRRGHAAGQMVDGDWHEMRNTCINVSV
jgi:hypothetical protein